MQEQRRRRVRSARGGSGPDDAAQRSPGGLVTVTHAPYAEDLPVAEMSVGSVRERFRDRLDIHPQAIALIDGVPVDDEAIVREGQLLSFIRPAGEKGNQLGMPWAGEHASQPRAELVTLSGDEAHAMTPEGDHASIKLAQLLQRLAPPLPDTRQVVLPDGVKCALPVPDGLILVHQTPPRVYRFRWIADDSEQDHGPGTRYRDVRLALPYVVVLAVFQGSGRGVPVLSSRNECFFSNQPLDLAGCETPLHYPALLNCSRFPAPDGKPLSWICTQKLRPGRSAGRGTLGESLQDGLRALLRHLMESGFNRSSEAHEGSSWYKESVDAAIDPRIGSVEAWERASSEDPLFVLEVPWLPTGLTLREIGERIAGQLGRRHELPANAGEIARLILNGARLERDRA